MTRSKSSYVNSYSSLTRSAVLSRAKRVLAGPPMPAPGFGKGHAFAKPGVSSQYAVLSRKAARQKAEAALELDSDAERTIIDVVKAATASLPGDVKARAMKETRQVISYSRKGYDPETTPFLASCEVCKEKKGARQHVFLCRTRYSVEKKRGAGRAEKEAADKIWSELNAYSLVCREALEVVQVRSAASRCLPLCTRAPMRASHIAHATCSNIHLIRIPIEFRMSGSDGRRRRVRG